MARQKRHGRPRVRLLFVIPFQPGEEFLGPGFHRAQILNVAAGHGVFRCLVVIAAVFAVHVVYRRIGSEPRLQLFAVSFDDQPGNVAFGVVQVAERQRPGLAGIHAGGRGVPVDAGRKAIGQAVVDFFGAEIAFRSGTPLISKGSGSVYDISGMSRYFVTAILKNSPEKLS